MPRIEFEEPTESVRECCQNTTVRLTRFVFQNDDAFVIYYAQFTNGHGEKRLSGIISLGEWGSDEVYDTHNIQTCAARVYGGMVGG